MAADGSITIDSKLNNADFKIGARDLTKAIKSLEMSTRKSSADMAKSASGYGNAMRTSVQAAREFKTELKSLEKQAADLRQQMENNGGAAKPYLEITRQIQQLEAELDKANEKADSVRESKGIDSSAWKSAVQTANELAEKIDELYAKRETLEKPTDAQLVNYAQSEHALQEMETRIDDLRQAGSEMGGSMSIMARNAGAAIGSLAMSAGRAAISIAKMVGHGALSFLKKLASSAKNAAIQLMKLAGRAVQSGIQKLGQLAGGAAKHLLGIGKATHKSSGGFKMGLKTLLKYGLGIRSLFFLFRRLRTAIADGLGEIAKKNPQVAAAVNSLKGALNGLKGSLASAFAPILTAVAPALTTLINLLTTAINTIGAFFAALTGQAYFSKATAAIAATGGAAKSAGGSVKELKRQLAGFDELEILTANDSGGGGGGGGGGGAGSGLSYVNVPIDSAIIDWVAELKKMWENADYEGIGHAIADGINHAFERAKNWISWNNVGGVVTKAVNSIVGIFNGLVDGINWPLIGETFAEGVNTIIKTVTLLQDLDIEGLARGLTSALNRFIQHVEWRELTDTMAFWFNKITNAILTAVETFEWGNAGKTFGASIANLVNKVHWDTIGKTFASLLDGTFVFLRDALAQFDWKDSARKFVAGINNLVTLPHWDVIGSTLGSMMDGALTWLHTAVTEFEWGKAGKSFHAAIANIASSVKWETIGQTLAGLLNGAFDFLRNALANFSWKDAAKKFIAAVNNLVALIHWDTIGTTLSNLMKGALDWLTTAVANFDWHGLGEDIKVLLEKIDWVGIGEKIKELIKTALKGLPEFIAGLLGQSLSDFMQDNPLLADIIEILRPGTKQEITSANLKRLGVNPDDIAQNYNKANLPSAYGLEKEGYYNGGFIVDNTRALEENTEAQQETGIEVESGLLWKWLGFGGSKNPEVDANIIEMPDTPLDSEVELEPGVKWGTGTKEGWLSAIEGGGEVDVGVNYYPEGQSPNSPFANTGLGKWLKQITDPKTPVETKIELLKWGWKNIEKFVGTDTPLGAFIKLIKDGWKDPKTWIGIVNTLFALLGLKKEGWTNLGGFVGVQNVLSAFIALAKSGWKDPAAWIGLGKALIATIGLTQGWSGTLLSWLTGNKWGNVGITLTLANVAEGLKKALKNIKTSLGLATGGVITSGGMVKRFAAGGAITGSGRAKWWNSLPKYASGTRRAHGTMFVAGEAGPEVVGHIGGRTEVLNKSQLAQVMYNAVTAGMITALRGLTFQIPAAATGSIVPYEVAAQIERSGREIQNTLDANNEELIQAMTSAIGSAVLSIVGAINAQGNRPAVGGVTAQSIIDEINRRTQMFSQSPLMGV